MFSAKLNAFNSILLVCIFLQYQYVATVAFVRYRQIYSCKVKPSLLSKFLVLPLIKKTFRFFYVKIVT